MALAPTLPVGHLIDDLSAHAPMMAAHLAVAALVGLWLGYGERCLWTLIALTGRRILAAAWALRPVARRPARPAVDAVRAPAGPLSVWLVRPDSRRGPPPPRLPDQHPTPDRHQVPAYSRVRARPLFEENP